MVTCLVLGLAFTTTGAQPATVETHPREPIVGLGYHPGNFIGPFAFDVIVRPLPHITFDLQAGYSKEGLLDGRVGLAPQLQWEFWRGPQTPYLGLAYRYGRVWLGGAAAASNGGFLIGGSQMRWRFGLGLLFGVGVLYKAPIDLQTATGAYSSQGGLFGTYEVGARYFF